MLIVIFELDYNCGNIMDAYLENLAQPCLHIDYLYGKYKKNLSVCDFWTHTNNEKFP